MRKLYAIAWKEIYTRFTDRHLLLIMIAAPLAIASIVGLAFGGLGPQSSPIQHIPVAVLNQDQGSSSLGFRFGDMLSSLLATGALPRSGGSEAVACHTVAGPAQGGDSGTPLKDLINGTVFDETVAGQLLQEGKIDPPQAAAGTAEYLEQAARSAVDHGVYTALVLVPPGFSSSLVALTDPRQSANKVDLLVYGNRGRVLASGIVRSVVDALSSQMVGGTIAIGATRSELAATQPATLGRLPQVDLNQLFACAFAPGSDWATLDSQPVQAAQASPAGGILVGVGSAQAMFFALFTGQFGILSMYEERKNWTLQRLVASPTPRWAILGGKLVGVMASVLFQLLALIMALTLVGSLLSGGVTMIWGKDLGRLAVLLLAVSTAVGGLGMLLAGVLRSIEQANIVASVLNMALGVLGGAFSFQLPRSVASVSLIYWGREAFQRLAAGDPDITLHLVVLFGQGVLMFGLGLWLFNRQFEV